MLSFEIEIRIVTKFGQGILMQGSVKNKLRATSNAPSSLPTSLLSPNSIN